MPTKYDDTTLATLQNEYLRIRDDHHDALQARAARVTLGSSVIRVFSPGSKEPMLRHLWRIDLGHLSSIRTQAEFRAWFVKRLGALALVVKKINQENPRIHPGYKWGHSTKVLCLFIREIVLCSRFFDDRLTDRLAPLLYIPIDGVVIDHVRRLGVPLSLRKIKHIDSAEKFFGVRDLLGEAATRAGVPRVWLDDVWTER